MSKFSCIKETVIPAVVKREIIDSTFRLSGNLSTAISIHNQEWNKKQVVSISTSHYLYDSVSLRELSDLALQLADILDENNKETSDGWIPFVATKDSVCPVPPDTLVAIKNGYWINGSDYQRADNWHWCHFAPRKGSIIAYKVK